MSANNKKKRKINKVKMNKAITVVAAIIVLEILFLAVYFVTTQIYKKSAGDNNDLSSENQSSEIDNATAENNTTASMNTTVAETTTSSNYTEEQTTKVEVTTKYVSSVFPNATTISFPTDDASWKLICLNRKRCVDASVEDSISLSYVAGSSEMMDSRAAAAYNQMYDAAAGDGIYLTPCSGYRSYSTQKRLYYEFVNDYIYSGYSESEAHDLASKRRNPPGSSEHNVGICMDIICASSSAGFQNTEEYAWLIANAQDYGFILRYPEDKVSVTGVKFEPWLWRYVGVENASAIKNSGLCLEEYLGLV